jgi:hypothetical protein
VVKAAIAALFYRLPADLRTVVAADLKGKDVPEATALIQDRFGWALSTMMDQAAYLADQAQYQADAANGHKGGVKTARKRRMGLVPKADPAGKNWRPDYGARLDKAVFAKFGKFPTYVTPLVPLMGAALRGTILLIGGVVDSHGRFVLPRATHAAGLAASTSTAYRALKALKAAGIITVDTPGDQDQATVWRYAPAADFDAGRARRILQAARNQATEQASELGA